jgi:hypothetical protein
MLNNRTRRDVIFNRVPSKADLDAGDLVVNSADGIAYTKLSTGQVVPIAGRSISGESGGSSFELPVATDAVLGGIKVGANLSITADGVLSAQQGEDGFVLLPATRSTLGGVIVGARLTVGPDGTLSADAQSLPIASGTVLGGVRVGQGLSIDGSGLLSTTAAELTLPPATNTTLGGVKVGTNLTVTADGTLNAGVSGSDRVLRAGDTMTGVLQFGSGTRAQFNQGSYVDLVSSRNGNPLQARTGTGDNYYLGFTASGGLSVSSNRDIEINTGGQGNYLFTSTMLRMDGGAFTSYPGHNRTTLRDFLWADTDQGDGFGLSFGTDGWAQYYATPGHRLIAPGDSRLELDQWGCYLNRALYTGSAGANPSLFVRASTNGIASIGFNNGSGETRAGITVSHSRADFIGYEQAWLRAGASTGWGWAEINGGWQEWEAVRFSRGGTWLASVDGNGNFVRRVTFAQALPADIPGLSAVVQLHPVAFASADSRQSLGFLPTELRRAIPEAVTEDDGYCSAALIPVLVKAVQELAARVAALEGN